MMTVSVYCIHNTVNGKNYVGKTQRSIQDRWQQHVVTAKSKPWRLSRAIRKYGRENFIVYPLAWAETQEKATVHERLYIISLESQNRDKGYNLTPGGDGASWWLGRKKSKEHLRKFAESMTRSDIPNKEIVPMYEQGLSSVAIAKRFNTCRATICWRLHRLGVKMRPAGNQTKKYQGASK